MGTFIEKLKKFENEMNFEKKGLTITVSGLSGSGKSTFAKALAEKLGLRYVSAGEIFREVAKELGVDIETMSKIRTEDLDLKVDIRTLEYAKKGSVVLDGRLTGWVAGDNADLKIWISCDLDVKAERVAKRENISFEEAKKNLEERDKNDAKAYKDLYGIDLFDTSIYDVIIDNTNLTYEEFVGDKVNEIVSFLEKKPF